ncbi:MAG: serine/threonine protein kinase [Planctomycetes bacterium]|nr:serine/threonine protein kinase [Planctomycetota bacterium]
MGAIPKAVGKYQVLGSIGRGGMGEVFKAYQPDLHRHVAIKTLLSGEQASEEFLQRFQREARMAAKLSHPNIVPIYDIGAEGKLHYIVMEYVEGRSLKQLLEEKKLDPEKSLRIALTIARALQFAHEHKIVHRDVKPANLLIDKQGRVRILDFGLARSMDGKGLTASGLMVGTPYYMSPEQAFGAPEELDHRTDLYSLGAVLYEMLTGRPPFEGGTVLAILRKIEDEDPAPPGISSRVDAVVMKALAKDRERRYQTAADLAEAIRACLESPAPDTARRLSSAAVFQIPRRVVWAGAGALAAVLLTWMLWPSPSPPPPAPAPARPAAAIPADLGAELRALLARKNDVTSPELAKFREDPQLRRVIADHFLKRGQYTRALEDLKGYEKAIMELASARALQRFVSPGLFRVSIPQPADLKGPEAFLMSALARHLEGKQDAARQKLKAAMNNDALPSHVLLVRAHIELIDILQNPGDEALKPLLASLRRDLDKSDELFILPLRAIAAQLAEDGGAARNCANALLASAPSSAETFLLSAILFLRAGRIDLAADEVYDAVRMDPKMWDSSILRVYLRWLEVLNDPVHEKLESSLEGKLDLPEMREALDERLRHDHYPAALLLRAVQESLDLKWDAAEEDLGRLERRLDGRLDLISVDHARLGAFVGAIGSRSRLLDATADLQAHLGRKSAAMATSEQINGEELPEEDRKELLKNNHLRLAHLHRSRQDKALWHIDQALKMGAQPQALREDNELGELRSRPSFSDLLKKYE